MHYYDSYADRIASTFADPRRAMHEPRTIVRPAQPCAYHAQVQALIIDDDGTPLCAACGMDAELARANGGQYAK